MQADATFLANIKLLDDTCCVRLYTLLHVVARAQSLKPVKLLSQQLPTFLLFRDRRSVAQQFWIRLRSFSDIVEATHSHYTYLRILMGCALPGEGKRRNGMWHGLRDDIIMRLLLAQTNKAEQKVAISFTAFVSM